MKYDVVFLDPPYDMKVIEYIIEFMRGNSLVNDGAVFVVETVKEDVFNFENGFTKVKEYVYGKTKVTVMWM